MDNNYKFKVNLGGMIDILSNHLYSSPNVFVRELLQNGTDAVSARLQKDPDFHQKDALIEIEVTEKQTIIFRDNGTGLDEDEIHSFLSVIGQSSKYDIENSRSNGDYIGRFGIGLLSCFMVTDHITVRTSSYKTPGKVLEWTGMADGTYTIHQSDITMNTGTEIILENNKTDKDTVIDDYYDPDEIANLIYYYGLFLQYPIYLLSGEERTRLNLQFTLDADKNKDLCMKAGKTFLGTDFLDCFNLTSDSGLFSGVAYVLPYPVSAAAHNMHRIYLKNMLLTESGERILPEWAFFIRCIINAENLRPTSSREDFYEDEALDIAREEIADCISDYFETLDHKNKPLLNKIVHIHNLAVKSVIADSDDSNSILLPYITFYTSLGEMTGKEIMEFGGNAFYTTDENQFRQLLPLYTQRSELFINAGYVYDNTIIRKIADKSRSTDIEQLTDSDIELMLDESDEENDEAVTRFMAAANKILRKYDCKAAVKSFHPTDIPTLYTINENAYRSRQIKRSMESADSVFGEMLSSFEQEEEKNAAACLYFNTDNLIIQRLINHPDQKHTDCCTEILYVQALLSGHFPLLHNELKTLNDNLYTLIKLSS